MIKYNSKRCFECLEKGSNFIKGKKLAYVEQVLLNKKKQRRKLPKKQAYMIDGL
jgi:hypothetical protein